MGGSRKTPLPSTAYAVSSVLSPLPPTLDPKANRCNLRPRALFALFSSSGRSRPLQTTGHHFRPLQTTTSDHFRPLSDLIWTSPFFAHSSPLVRKRDFTFSLLQFSEALLLSKSRPGAPKGRPRAPKRRPQSPAGDLLSLAGISSLLKKPEVFL